MTLPFRSALSTLTMGLMVGFISAPAFVITACAAADGGVADPGDRLLDPSSSTPGLAVGEDAPGGTLRDPAQQTVSLEDLYADGPSVLVFYRGGWCPFCTRDLKDWETAIPEFDAAGANVIAVSLESAEHAVQTAEKNDLSMRVLVDETGEVVRGFRLGFALDEGTQSRYRGYGIDLETSNSNGAWELPAPAVFVIDRDGVVRYSHADWDYRTRIGYEGALEAVRDLG